MWLNELKDHEEAVWLEVRPNTLVATSIKGMTDFSVDFANGMRQMKTLHNKQWRVWDRKPTAILRRETKWVDE